MEDNTRKPEAIDYYTYEGEMARAERHSVRWMKAALIEFILIIGMAIGFLIYESQFEDVVTTTQTVTQDTGSEGGTNTFNGDFYGGDYNGKTDSK